MPYFGSPPASSLLSAGDIAAGAITTAKFASGAVDAAAIGANAVDSSELVNGSVDLAHLSSTGTASSSTFLRGDNAWAAAGGILAVHTATDTAYATTTSTGYVDGGTEITFTPISASSKLVIFFNSVFGYETNYQEANMHNYWRLYDTTNSVAVKEMVNFVGHFNAGDEMESGFWMGPGSIMAVYSGSHAVESTTIRCEIKTSHASYYVTGIGYTPNANTWIILEI